jgi:hypothetical protein
MVGGSITGIVADMVVTAGCKPNIAFSSCSLALPGAELATASRTL